MRHSWPGESEHLKPKAVSNRITSVHSTIATDCDRVTPTDWNEHLRVAWSGILRLIRNIRIVCGQECLTMDGMIAN